MPLLLRAQARAGLLGPVCFYDAIRLGRRRQLFWARGAYSLFLLGLLLFVYSRWCLDRQVDVRAVLGGKSLDRNALADFSAAFFLAFLVVQFVAACLLTPLFTAGAVTEEKEARTLDYSLATDLSGREIVLGKTAARLGSLLLILLTGLPFLALMQVIGGIDRELLLAGFLATGVTMLSLTALGVLVSVHARRPRQAVLWTFGLAVLYLAGSGMSWLTLWAEAGIRPGPVGGLASDAVLEAVVQALNAGNPVSVALRIYQGVSGGAALGTVMWGPVLVYCAAHAIAAIVFITWAGLRLRPVALRTSKGRQQIAGPNPLEPPSRGGKGGEDGVSAVPSGGLRPPLRRRRWFRPGVGDRPMLWKELVVERSRMPWLGRTAVAVLGPALFLPAAGALLFEGFLRYKQDGAGEYLNLWARAGGAFVACVMLLLVALRAAAAVSGERDRHTLDDLMATPLSPRRILFAKWLGAMAAPRWPALWLVAIWVLGVAFGGLDVGAVPLIAGYWFVLAVFLASLGLCCSVQFQTTHRAIQATVLTLVGLGAAHWLLWVFASPMLSWLGGPATTFGDVIEFEAVGLTPPLTFAVLAYPPGNASATGLGWLAVPLVRGVAFWVLAAAVLWAVASASFRVQFNDVACARRGNVRAWLRRRPVVIAGTLSVLCACCLLGVWRVTQPYTAAARYTEAAAEAERLDGGWRYPELEARRRVVADEANAAFQAPIFPASGAWRGWYPGKTWPSNEDTARTLTEVAPERQLNVEQSEMLRKDLDAIPAARAQARTFIDYSWGRAPIRYAKDGVSTPLPHVQRYRSIAEVLRYDAMQRAQDGDVDGAVASCRACLNAGRAIGDEPCFVSQIVRIACRGLALSAIERTLAQGEPSEAALAGLQTQLEDEESDELCLPGMRGERAMMDAFFGAIEEGGLSISMLLGILRDARLPPDLPLADRLLCVAGLSVRAQRAEMLRLMNKLVEAAKAPPEEHVEHVEEILAGAGMLAPLVRTRVPAVGRAGESIRRGHAQARCAIVLVAVERFRKRNGRWPETLAELTPEWLKEIPLDTYDGKPLRYRRLADGVVVYSVYKDKVDNGGKLSRGFWGTNPKYENTDLGYRLWDPDKRRQPALPPEPKGKKSSGR